MKSSPRMFALLLALNASPIAAFSPPWPFNWSTIQPQAFPGSRNRFMLPSELESLAKFAMLNIWGLNATCVEWNGTSSYPASCGDGGCNCVAPTGEKQRWIPNMNTSLQTQSIALKSASTGGRFLPVVGYLDWPTAQQYFGDLGTVYRRAVCTLATFRCKQGRRRLFQGQL